MGIRREQPPATSTPPAPVSAPTPSSVPTTSSWATPSRTARLPRLAMSRTCPDVQMPDSPGEGAGASPSKLALLSYPWPHHPSCLNVLKKQVSALLSLLSVIFSSLVGGSRICVCKNGSGIQSECSKFKCEVDCQSDCNDLTSNGGKCFSELACQQDLLFEINCEPWASAVKCSSN